MHILFVLHDLSLTGAPKLGLQIAAAFARQHKVTLIARQDGELRAQIPRRIFNSVIIDDSLHESNEPDLADRIAAGRRIVEQIKPDLIYANSLAAGDWISIAKHAHVPHVLHIHEMRQGMLGLNRNHIFDAEDIANADYAVFASEECWRDFNDLFSYPPGKGMNFGVSVDIKLIRQHAKDQPLPARRHDNRVYRYSPRAQRRRKLIAMCGTAVPRKGSDIFWMLAKQLPEHDFLWIGSWNDDDFSRQHNTALALNKKTPLDNLYWTNTVANPYALLAQADFFTLTSREDPNPLVVLESLVLGIPVVSFTHTGSSHRLTSRHGFSLWGDPDADRLAKFLQRFFPQATATKPASKSLLDSIDIHKNADRLSQHLMQRFSSL